MERQQDSIIMGCDPPHLEITQNPAGGVENTAAVLDCTARQWVAECLNVGCICRYEIPTYCVNASRPSALLQDTVSEPFRAASGRRFERIQASASTARPRDLARSVITPPACRNCTPVAGNR